MQLTAETHLTAMQFECTFTHRYTYAGRGQTYETIEDADEAMYFGRCLRTLLAARFPESFNGRHRSARASHQAGALPAFPQQGRPHCGGARAFQRIGDRKTATLPSPHKMRRIDRFFLHRACGLGGEAEVVGEWLHARCRGACRSTRPPRPRDRTPT